MKIKPRYEDDDRGEWKVTNVIDYETREVFIGSFADCYAYIKARQQGLVEE